ncbi:ANR family transcriptional regulator [Aeromonas enteropelogenes]|uniref:ANR family transcriptional regulator n=1 Tax=Aeromonas enteropelogenes TaxID=29489 RepID=UPI003BA1832F
MNEKKVSDYMLLAGQAAELERQGALDKAAQAWRIAAPLAVKEENREWANARQQRCQYIVDEPIRLAGGGREMLGVKKMPSVLRNLGATEAA